MPKSGSQAQPRTVLIVEDDQDLRAMLTIILNNEGWAVKTAANGFEALQTLSKGNLPDLILTDMHMPIMGGRELLDRVLGDSRTKDIPVIFASGEDNFERKIELLGAKAYLKKPYRLEKLTSTVNEYLH